MFKRVGKRLLSPVGLGLLFCVGSFVVIFSAQSWALLPAYAPYADTNGRYGRHRL